MATRGRTGRVVVTDASRGGLTQVVRAGRHVLIADEPLGIGDDRGPTPYDLLLAALGTCTAMTLRLYAERKGWPLTEITVGLTHDRVHADDSRGSTTTPRKIERIDAVVSLAGPLSDEQRDRLLEVAERCPVHQTLMMELRIVTRLRE
jgi:putative redox protein